MTETIHELPNPFAELDRKPDRITVEFDDATFVYEDRRPEYDTDSGVTPTIAFQRRRKVK